jgi:hypothetical protein
MPNIRTAVVATAFLAAFVGPALSAGLPTTVGECNSTKITQFGSRLDGVPNSGSAVTYANGGHQVSYDMVPGIQHSRVGDPIKLCLIQLPSNCPPGDDRGKIYRATNLRTHATWEAPDTQHSCGGA